MMFRYVASIKKSCNLKNPLIVYTLATFNFYVIATAAGRPKQLKLCACVKLLCTYYDCLLLVYVCVFKSAIKTWESPERFLI